MEAPRRLCAAAFSALLLLLLLIGGSGWLQGLAWWLRSCAGSWLPKLSSKGGDEKVETTTTTQASTTTKERSGRPLPLLVARRLHASGFNAREPVSSMFYEEEPTWVWSNETEAEFEAIYASTQRESACSDNRMIRAKKSPHGLLSRVRDTGDLMLEGILDNVTVLYGEHGCPQAPNMSSDAYMYCSFLPFSSCKSGRASPNCSRAVRCLENTAVLFRNRRVAWLWQRLRARGLVQEALASAPAVCGKAKSHSEECMAMLEKYHIVGPPMLGRAPRQLPESLVNNWTKLQCETWTQADRLERELHMGVIRSLLVKQVFLPSSHVKAAIAAVEEKWRRAPTPLLIVHARRTDKRNDMVPLLRHERMIAKHEATLSALAKLETAAERLGRISFKSIYFISDDPKIVEDQKALKSLTNAGALKPEVLTTPFANSSSFEKNYWHRGHLALPGQFRVEMNNHLLGELFWAAERASYVVGNGKSAVTQFAAQLLGAKFRMDPNALALFEDDVTTLSCLQETEKEDWL